ncbi:MAG TPA: hypothetical protein VMV69_10970 [Pirellulales bacterium]|nr:hypothetical protein [Pirellulales bacterium]
MIEIASVGIPVPLGGGSPSARKGGDGELAGQAALRFQWVNRIAKEP